MVVVDERAGQGLIETAKLAALARQVIGFDSARGDSLQVIMLPFPAAEAVAAPPPAAELPRKLPLAKPAESPQAEDERLPVYAGLALALLALIVLWVLRARQRKRQRQAEALAAEAREPSETFEAPLEALRQQVLFDPKVAASVVKLWIQNP